MMVMTLLLAIGLFEEEETSLIEFSMNNDKSYLEERTN